MRRFYAWGRENSGDDDSWERRIAEGMANFQLIQREIAEAQRWRVRFCIFLWLVVLACWCGAAARML